MRSNRGHVPSTFHPIVTTSRRSNNKTSKHRNIETSSCRCPRTSVISPAESCGVASDALAKCPLLPSGVTGRTEGGPAQADFASGIDLSEGVKRSNI